MSDLFDKLLKEAGRADQEELKMADAGRTQTMAAYNAKPGEKARKNYVAARELYEETIDRLVAKYLPDDVPEPEGERFANRKQALNFLVSQGYQISQGKFYKDCKAGFPQIHKDKTVSRFHVLQYGQQIDVATRSAPDNEKSKGLKDKKTQLEIDKLERDSRKEDDRWLLKEEAWAALAGILGTLQDSLRHHFNTGQGQLVHLAGGEPARGPEVYEGCEELLSKAFNEVCATGKIEGVFDVEEEK